MLRRVGVRVCSLSAPPAPHPPRPAHVSCVRPFPSSAPSPCPLPFLSGLCLSVCVGGGQSIRRGAGQGVPSPMQCCV